MSVFLESGEIIYARPLKETIGFLLSLLKNEELLIPTESDNFNINSNNVMVETQKKHPTKR